MINRNMFFVANWKMFGRPAYYKILEKVNKYIIRHKKNKGLNKGLDNQDYKLEYKR